MSDAAHPIWNCDDDAIKIEYQRALDEREEWFDLHQRADSEAERLSAERDTLSVAIEKVRQACVEQRKLSAFGSSDIGAKLMANRVLDLLSDKKEDG